MEGSLTEDVLFNRMEVVQMDGASWLCFRLRDEDDIGAIGIVLAKAYCRWLETTGDTCIGVSSQLQS